jgi:hypothetical protein
MPTVREPPDVADLAEDEQGRVRPDARHGTQELGLRLLLHLGFRCEIGVSSQSNSFCGPVRAAAPLPA